MKFDFDKFNLSQKIYSVVGVVAGILVYMNDKDDLNFAIGLILLTAVLVFLCKYQKATKFVNVSALLGGILIAVVFGNSLYQNQQYKQELAGQRAFERDGHYYSVVSKRKDKAQRKTTTINKFKTMQECKETLDESSGADILSKECVQGDGRYDDIFNRKGPIGKWYILHELGDSGPVALVYDYERWKPSEVIAKYVHDEFIRLQDYATKELKGTGFSYSFYLVNPKGKVEEAKIEDKELDIASLQLSKEESQKWGGQSANKTKDGSYYAVTVMEYLENDGERSGIIETYIARFKEKSQCDNNVQKSAYDGNGVKTVSKKCVEGDGRFNNLFNNKPIDQWYIRWDYWDDLAENAAKLIFIKVYAFTEKWQLPLTKEFVHGKAMRDRKESSKYNVEILVVSPKGETTKY